MVDARKHIIVIGAGIIGASIGYHLARRGIGVTVVDGSEPASGATSRSFAWINASYGNPKPYFDLRLTSMYDYRRLDAELGGALALNTSGALDWDRDEPAMRQAVAALQAWGYPIRLVGRDEIADLEPRLADPPPLAAFAELEGSLDPAAAARTLIEAARGLGADIRIGSGVSEIVRENDRVRGVAVAGEEVAADGVVVAAGTGATDLLEPLGVRLPMNNRPGLLAWTRPVEPALNRLLQSPGCHLKQEADGRIVACEDFTGGSLAVGPEALTGRLLERVTGLLPHLGNVALDHHTIGERPTPVDGFPAVGMAAEVSGLYVAVMHSGITLAPAIGRFAATEILDGTQIEMLAPFRPDRFG